MNRLGIRSKLEKRIDSQIDSLKNYTPGGDLGYVLRREAGHDLGHTDIRIPEMLMLTIDKRIIEVLDHSGRYRITDHIAYSDPTGRYRITNQIGSSDKWGYIPAKLGYNDIQSLERDLLMALDFYDIENCSKV
jgi:hypothetical protein